MDFIFWILGYLFGSLPFALWITHLVKHVDVRDGGSGNVTTTNTIRQAGWLPGLSVLLLDIAKGFVPVWFAVRAGLPAWSVALTAGLVVVGHCWPVLAGFRGGMGLAATGGTLFAVSVPSALVALALLIFLALTIKHSARAALFTGLFAPVLFWLLNLRDVELWVMAATGLVIAVRFTVDWNRQYRELWLDREEN
ncbi:MAG: glycerol-3-phosphate acyltransferase [Anaerolineales bacterium]|nr:glycerol-3-phosphate acyltransferase [Anaerolineales bacterium]